MIRAIPSVKREGIPEIPVIPSRLQDFNVAYTTSIFTIKKVNTRILVLTFYIT